MIGIVRDLVKSDYVTDQEIYEFITDNLQKFSESDEIFSNTLLNNGVYNVSYNTTRFILIDLERKYGNKFNKENPDTLDEVVNNKYRWTVEHVLPKGNPMPDHWEEALKPLPSDITIEDILEDIVHQIGNLTLTGYNSELSNKPFYLKKTQVHEGIAVGLQNGLFLNQDIINKEKWGLDEIFERNEILSKKIVDGYTFKKWDF